MSFFKNYHHYLNLQSMMSQDLKSHGFLMKTYNLLQSESYKDIIDWIPAGNGFIIHSVERLQIEVLPTYFKHSNFQSFVRQLNMYGFHKIRTSKDTNYYTHDHFVKGDKDNIKIINRKAEKKMLKKSSTQQKQDTQVQCQKQTNVNLSHLPMILKMNMNLLEEQNYLIHILKKQWQEMRKKRIFVEEKEGLTDHNSSGNVKYKIQQERTLRSLDTYWNMQQQMYSKLYMESAIMLNREDGTAPTHTSISKI